MQRLGVAVAIVLVVAAAALTGFCREYSGDFHYHLMLGRWTLAHHAIYRHDVHSYTAYGQPMYISAWLGDAILAWLFAHGEYVACYLARAACLVVHVSMLLVAARRAAVSLAVGALAGMLLVAQSFYAFYLRPEMFGFACFSIVWALLAASDEGGWRWRAPLLYAVLLFWVNVHGSSSFGVLVLGVFVVEKMARARKDLRTAAAYAALGLGALLLMQLNPEGLGAFTAFRVLIPTYLAHTTEWYPQPLATMPVLLGAAIVAAAVTAALAGKEASFWRTAAALVLTVWGLRHRRFATFALLALLPATVHHVGVLKARWQRAATSRLPPALVALAFAGCLGVWVVGRHALSEIGTGIDRASYPVEACEWAKQHLPTGKLLNNFDFGSYLMFCLEQPLFVDQRAQSLYPESFYKTYIEAGSSQDGFDRLVSTWDFGWAFVKYDPLTTRIAARPDDWRLAYFDDKALVYVRRAHNPDAVGFRFLDPARLAGLAELTGADLAAASVELTTQLARDPHGYRTALAALALAAANRDRGQFDAAMAALGDRPPTAEVAYLAGRYAYATGDDPRALAMFGLMEKLGGDARLTYPMVSEIQKRQASERPKMK